MFCKDSGIVILFAFFRWLPIEGSRKGEVFVNIPEILQFRALLAGYIVRGVVKKCFSRCLHSEGNL